MSESEEEGEAERGAKIKEERERKYAREMIT